MKKVTLIDIALAAGVSRSAVARVILGTGGKAVRVSEETGEKIQQVARRLGYSPNRQAQQLRGKASRTFGVLLDTGNLPVMSERLFAIEAEACRRGYRMLIGRCHSDEAGLREYVDDFSGRGVEAIFCLFDLMPGRDERAVDCFKRFRKVIFHGRPAWPGGYAIRVDTERAIGDAVDHLVSRGKRRLGIALWNAGRDELMAVRREAFSASVASHRLEETVWDASAQGQEPSPELLDLGIEYLVAQKRCDAVLASNDVWGTRFIQRLRERGARVPEDVAVVGYDNLEISRVISPPLTTVDQSHDSYAKAAVDMLIAVAGGQRISVAARVVSIAPELVLRASS